MILAALTICGPFGYVSPIPGPPAAIAIRVSPTRYRITFTNMFVTDLRDHIELAPPVVSVAGDEIRVTQARNDVYTDFEANPPIIRFCQRDVVYVAGLPPGKITLRWTYVPTDGREPNTVSLPLTVLDVPFRPRARAGLPPTPPPPVPVIPTLSGSALALLAAVLAIVGAAACRS
jgi:hypothetical protein